MPANLPPQYYELERSFRAERDPREKLRMAEELLRIMPKHKGTDKLQADMKAKISDLKKQISTGDKGHGAKHAVTHDHIEREGAGQVILIGPPNSGKSSLVDSLTHAAPEVGDYPYTTREPQAGMMPYETIQIQLIDTPPIAPDLYEPYMNNLIRAADLVVLVVDPFDPKLQSAVEHILERLSSKHIRLSGPDADSSQDPLWVTKRAIIAVHRAPEDESIQAWRDVLNRLLPGIPQITTSVLDDSVLQGFKRATFDALKIVRVYTKHIGKDVELIDPVVLPIGSTVEQAAASIHKDFAAKLKFARLWGHGKFEGQRVQRDYVLADGDVVEFHI